MTPPYIALQIISPLNYNFLFFGSFYQLFRKFATERIQFRLFIEN